MPTQATRPFSRPLVLQRHLSLRAGGLRTHRAKNAATGSETGYARRVRRPAAQSGVVALVSIVALAALVAAGCGPMRGPLAAPLGPQLAPPEVIAAHNAWADSIEHLWSRAAINLIMPRSDSHGERVRYDTEGHLFLIKPDRLFLHGQVLGQEVFKMGLDSERFWLWVRPGANTVWTGRRGGEGERRFILAPADLLAALGVLPIDLAPDELAAFDTQPNQYVLTRQRMFGGEKIPVRRTWFDRRSLRPVRIDLFDDAGVCIVMAELLRYQRIGEVDVCTAYRARFYSETEVDLVLQLSDVKLDKEPPAGVFVYKVPPGAKVEDLDAGPSRDDNSK
jgi:hypothetical protein